MKCATSSAPSRRKRRSSYRPTFSKKSKRFAAAPSSSPRAACWRTRRPPNCWRGRRATARLRSRLPPPTRKVRSISFPNTRGSGRSMSSNGSMVSPGSRCELQRPVPPPTRSRACSAGRTSRSPNSTWSARRSMTCSATSQSMVRRTDMRPTLLVFRREFAAYFSTPVAAVFLIVFLALAAGMAFLVSGFFDRGQADLSGFFFWHPWLFLVLMPAIAMRLWAEERRSGTIELLMTLPVHPWQIVVGKWLAAWAFAALALVLTMPLWITVNALGSPDNGVILSSYVGSWLMAGAFLALAAAISGLTKSQVLAFIGGTTVSFLFVMAGFDLVISVVREWAPGVVIDAVRSMSFFAHFQHITDGVLELPSIIFFVSLIVFSLWLNVRIIEVKKAA